MKYNIYPASLSAKKRPGAENAANVFNQNCGEERRGCCDSRNISHLPLNLAQSLHHRLALILTLYPDYLIHS
jgi:hypothetical protein